MKMEIDRTGPFVTVNLALAEAEWEWELEQRRVDRELDPFDLGLYSVRPCHRFPGDPDWRR
jgi:hypothetical protein